MRPLSKEILCLRVCPKLWLQLRIRLRSINKIGFYGGYTWYAFPSRSKQASMAILYFIRIVQYLISSNLNYFSHAINAYLVSKYAKDDKLYPKEVKMRSTVDHRLYFDCGVLFQCVKSVAVSKLM